MKMNTDAQRHMKHDVIIQLPFIIKYAMSEQNFLLILVKNSSVTG